MKNEFKVGDLVKLNPEKKYYQYGIGGVKQDEVGKIIKINSNGSYVVDFPSQNDWKGCNDDCILVNVIKTLNDLQFADIITLKNGERYVIADRCMCGEESFYSRDCDELLVWYNDDLTQNEKDRDEDIVKVERAGQVIYEREEVVEMTIAEISEKLGYEVKVVKEK